LVTSECADTRALTAGRGTPLLSFTAATAGLRSRAPARHRARHAGALSAPSSHHISLVVAYTCQSLVTGLYIGCSDSGQFSLAKPREHVPVEQVLVLGTRCRPQVAPGFEPAFGIRLQALLPRLRGDPDAAPGVRLRP
jgi:hypothetical protein